MPEEITTTTMSIGLYHEDVARADSKYRDGTKVLCKVATKQSHCTLIHTSGTIQELLRLLRLTHTIIFQGQRNTKGHLDSAKTYVMTSGPARW